jgi:WhiB family redox-sensing transcriptional regulator
MGKYAINVFGEDINLYRLYLEFYAVMSESGVQPNCTSAPDMFYPDNRAQNSYHDIAYAKKACRMCPLLDACATYAIIANERDGIWGGLTTNERDNIIKGVESNGDMEAFERKGYLKYTRRRSPVPQIPRSTKDIK